MVSGLALLPTFHKTPEIGRAVLITDPWYLIPGNDAAACASLLPRIQTTGIRHRGSELMPIRLRPAVGAGVWQGSDP
jgi:hypothetical protein